MRTAVVIDSAMVALLMAGSAFVRWGASHGAALVVLAVAALVLFIGGRRVSAEYRVFLCRALAVFLVVQTVAECLYRAFDPAPDPSGEYLPLHYCSVMMFVSAYALWTRAPWASAMVYFSVLTASIQALVTPALTYAFPHPRFLFFFLSHGSLLLAALALPLLRDWRARRWDFLLAALLMDIYMISIIPVNLMLGTNYGFMQFAPPGSILTYLGPAPWYFLLLHIPGIPLFWLLSLAVRPSAKS